MSQPSQQDKVTAELRRAIVAGEFARGSFLPSSRELALRFGVVRNTVMAGLGPLVEEGLVESLPKRGYRVIGAPSAFEVVWTQGGQLLPAGEEELGHGGELRAEIRQAPGPVARLLQGPDGMTVAVRSTVHRYAGAPWALREFCTPRSVADVARRLLEPEGVDEERLLAEHGLGQDGIRSCWSTRAATADEARLLKSGSAPVHFIQRTGFHQGQPVFCELTAIRADRVHLSRSAGNPPEMPET
ncbi:GntR family transcriptional regulator [Streptomyces sp. NRRL S-350]|uniref:GntR family transcriptional regulator n=1 Tax=Streptomyces sp. NRRL S-350 TaxID=1463902 RepID=UPI000B1525BB|nr:GntR family transcriptional regulator [Streptomyces sp. NRRL S-350]